MRLKGFPGHPHRYRFVNVFATSFAVLCFIVAPVTGPVTDHYAPVGRYAGHWGVDIAAPEGTEVRAPVGGVVTFAGTVAGMKTVTVRVGGGMRISMSYLSAVVVSAGTDVGPDHVIGLSGRAHGQPALHLSVRMSGVYVDPAGFLNCGGGTIRLLPDR